LALEADAYKDAPPMPLDILGAESQGMIGYVIQQELCRARPSQGFVTLLTQILVDEADPAFKAPSKPIGPIYDEAAARALAAERGWHIAKDGTHWRRVVASPQPREIIELAAIRALIGDRIVPICCGGGGVPVVRSGDGGLSGVEAVIDKDLAAATLAEALSADRLVILTDVEGVFKDWGSASPELIAKIDAAHCDPADFAAGSMQPKLLATCRFAQSGGEARIGDLAQAAEVLAGRAGTAITA
jgi:carbamate kinase